MELTPSDSPNQNGDTTLKNLAGHPSQIFMTLLSGYFVNLFQNDNHCSLLCYTIGKKILELLAL